ncbi:MAG: glycosyltransferase family 4 protein [Anaerolineae bacterium]|nr:glycosyltransferase family 4 protein [Anaerolineae bacterium]
MIRSTGRRILMLLENNPYPQDGRVRLEAETLVAAGYHVTVICPAQSDQPWQEIIDGTQIYRYPFPPEGDGLLGYMIEYGYSFLATLFLSLFVSIRAGFDVIHAHNPPDIFVFIAIIYKLLGKRFVFDHHDLSPEVYYYARFQGGGNKIVYQILVWLEQLSCKLADHVIATNESYKALQQVRSKIPADQITIVRNGPNLTRFHPLPPIPDLTNSAGTIIGYAGEMSVQDGLDYLLWALYHLTYDLDRTDYYCILMGDGSELATLKQMVEQLKLEQHVCFTGYLHGDDFIRHLSSADICVVPDPSNPYNDRCTMIKIAEYMALGKPIVAFDLPEHRYTAQNAAIYVRPNDKLEFSYAIAQLMDSPERRQTMGVYGRKRVESRLAWSHSAKNLLEAYQYLYPEPSKESRVVL